MLFYKSKYTEIHYHEEDKLVETVWLGFASSSDYRQSLAAYVEVIRAQEVERWLGDYREARVVRLADQAWAVKEWAPVFMPLASNLKKMAKVNAKDLFNQVSSTNMKQQLDVTRLPFPFQEFDDYDEARAWVLS
ncbi:hypothetical protein [Pontibacter pamirensis]|uniref:hypothetical protein n=1 Tax=Pontibacter pamirensis TaxID=2562824 RepID=UPI0013899913|nr:hypothetical protein [Pontibacter pamirensis]